MKTKLLRKLRNIGRNQITVLLVGKTDGIITRMSYSYNDDAYRDLFVWNDTEDEVREKACQIYLNSNIDRIRQDYCKYSRKHKQNHGK